MKPSAAKRLFQIAIKNTCGANNGTRQTSIYVLSLSWRRQNGAMEDKIVVKWERKKENTIGPQENSELTLIANGLWEQIVSFFPFAVVCNTHSSLYMRKSAVSLELDGL